MTDRCAKLRKQKRYHYNSVSFSLSGSLRQSSDVQVRFFKSRFKVYVWDIFFLFVENQPIDVGDITWQVSVWGKILNVMKCNIVSFQGHIVTQKC